MLGSGKLQAQGTASFACAGSQKILQRSREEPVDVCHTDFFFLVDFLLLCFWVCFLKEVKKKAKEEKDRSFFLMHMDVKTQTKLQ